jgi:hypothetical protein
MRRLLRLFSSAVLLTFALPPSLAAQPLPESWADAEDRPGRVDFSASLGLLAPTDWSDLVLLGSISPATGVFEQVLVRDLRVEPDTQLDGAVTYWRGRYGFRVQGGLSKSSLIVGGPDAASSDALKIDVDTWSYDVRGVIGMVEYAPRRWVWPYGFFGFGGITYDLERTLSPSLLTFIERSPSTRGRPPTIVVEEDGREFLLAVDELGTETVFALNLGIGTDFRVPLGPTGLGVRLELSDQIAPSPVGLRIGNLRRSRPLTSDTGVQFALVHHLRIAAGIVLQIGR